MTEELKAKIDILLARGYKFIFLDPGQGYSGTSYHVIQIPDNITDQDLLDRIDFCVSQRDLCAKLREYIDIKRLS